MRRYNSDDSGRTRIDARPRNSWATQAGLRGVHRGMNGKVIGGYTDDGRGFGTKAGGSSWQDRARGPAPASGANLNSRQNLFKEMSAAGPDALTLAMRAKAQSLGVTDEQFNAAAGKIKTNAEITPAKPAAAPAPAPTPTQTSVLPTPPKPAAPAPTAPAGPPPVSKINGMPASQAIAQARVGAERSWAGKALKSPTTPIARAAAVQPPTPGSPAPVAARPSWQTAIQPNSISSTAAPAKKTGGLEGLIASIDKTRAENAKLLGK